MSYKIAIDAGHGLYTAGKRCDKTLDPNETREWCLNNRIAVLIEEGLKEYTGYELIRTDDRTGKTDVSRPERCRRANEFGADIFCSLHANAAEKKFSGGGIVLYTCKGLSANGTTRTLQKDLYDRLIAHTGLVGNRAKPLGQYNYDVLVLTNMPAILSELGFMNSMVDTPIILTEEFAKQAAQAYIEFFVANGKLKRKDEAEQPEIPDEAEKETESILDVLRKLINLIIKWAKG
jgi:N-acetylmuramoyl-L-alanine amidase